MWHHDAAGRRLKLVVLLHDVGIDGRPTHVIAGTQHIEGNDTLYWHDMQMTHTVLARYADALREEQSELCTCRLS